VKASCSGGLRRVKNASPWMAATIARSCVLVRGLAIYYTHIVYTYTCTLSAPIRIYYAYHNRNHVIHHTHTHTHTHTHHTTHIEIYYAHHNRNHTKCTGDPWSAIISHGKNPYGFSVACPPPSATGSDREGHSAGEFKAVSYLGGVLSICARASIYKEHRLRSSV